MTKANDIFKNNDKETFPMCPQLPVSSQGQVTIPLGVRRALGIGAGDKIDIVELRKCE